MIRKLNSPAYRAVNLVRHEVCYVSCEKFKSDQKYYTTVSVDITRSATAMMDGSDVRKGDHVLSF